MSQDTQDAKALLKWGVLIILIIAALSVVWSVVGTAAKVASAPAAVLNKTMDTDNIITSYEWFYDTEAAYTARLQQVIAGKNTLATEVDPKEKRMLRVDLGAMQQSCRDLATKYNANSNKMNKSVFKGWALPESLSINNCN